jgi:hypothetical protein
MWRMYSHSDPHGTQQLWYEMHGLIVRNQYTIPGSPNLNSSVGIVYDNFLIQKSKSKSKNKVTNKKETKLVAPQKDFAIRNACMRT